MKYVFLLISASLLIHAGSYGQIVPSLTIPRGHKNIVSNCYFTPNDKYIISTDEDNVLCIWDGDDGRQIFTIRDSSSSFTDIQVSQNNNYIVTRAGAERLCLIDFRSLKVKTIQRGVREFSLDKKQDILYFIKDSAIWKHDIKSNITKKITTSILYDPSQLYVISPAAICVEDEKGIQIINPVTGSTQPIKPNKYNLELQDFHDRTGYILCSYFDSDAGVLNLYSINTNTKKIVGHVKLKGQYANYDCAFTSNPALFIMTALLDNGDGAYLTNPPAIYSFKTGAIVKEIGNEYIHSINEMNMNFSRKSIILKQMPLHELEHYLRYDFEDTNSPFTIFKRKGNDDLYPKFASANNSKKIALFKKNSLLPLIYPSGRVTDEGPPLIEKYSELLIHFPPLEGANKLQQRFHFLPPGKIALNDSTFFSFPENRYGKVHTGVLYYLKSGRKPDSTIIFYDHMAIPIQGAEQLFWILDKKFFVFNIADRMLTDSIVFPSHFVLAGIHHAGSNVLINREESLSDPGRRAVVYDIAAKKVIDTVSSREDFLQPKEEPGYSHRIEGSPPINSIVVKDYDYIRKTLFEYPFTSGGEDSVAVLDSLGENYSYHVIKHLPYLRFIKDPEKRGSQSKDLSEKLGHLLTVQVKYWDKDCYIIMTNENKLFLYSVLKDSIIRMINCPTAKNARLYILPNKKVIVSDKNKNGVYVLDIESGRMLAHLAGYYNSNIIQPKGLLVLQDAAFENYYVYSENRLHRVSSITAFSETDYVVNTTAGLFDGTAKAIENLYMLINDASDNAKPWKTIDLGQLKAKYFIPGLWDKLISGDSADLPDVESIRQISLAPEIIVDTGYSFQKPYRVTLLDKGGGIGAVRLVINGKEVTSDARKPGTVTGKKLTLDIDLNPYKRFFTPGDNTIQIFSTNNDSSLTSKGTITRSTTSVKEFAHPRLFIISIGTSDYKGNEIDLQYAAKDAYDIATSLKAGSKKLFGADSTRVYLLTSLQSDSTLLPSKLNIERVFKELSRQVAAKDIVVLYLSGHGINTSGANSDFYYLTKDAYTSNPGAYTFKEVLKHTSVSSNEFTEYLKNISALKQLFIIDACASGKIVDNLVAHRDIPYSTLKALDRMKDRTGTHIITGCAADAVSYEASRFGQGVLTYSLLEGMKGASLRENKFLDVVEWFQYARERVPQLAEGLGGIQTPQVYSPSGNQSFDIAEFDEEEKRQIPLAAPKAVFIKSIFQEEERFADVISLGRTLDSHLSETASRDQKNSFMYLPVDVFPNAYQVLGRYTLLPGSIRANIRITRNSEPDAIRSFTINAPDAVSLSKEILGKIKDLK